jgi:hypothetical protein
MAIAGESFTTDQTSATKVFTANIWLNGQQIATSEQIAGTFRIHELNIKSVARAGALNTPR